MRHAPTGQRAVQPRLHFRATPRVRRRIGLHLPEGAGSDHKPVIGADTARDL